MSNSACLKCGKCPVFSPQYYLKHKCMHCYCGVVHHRGIPQDIMPATAGRPGSSRHLATASPDPSDDVMALADAPSLEADGKNSKANIGVPVAPFVWTRHTRRSRSQVRR
jgi:hypothetical protein